MAAPFRFPITNHLKGDVFTLRLVVGSQNVPVDVILDTGSSTLIVSGASYDESSDGAAVSTRLLQSASFSSGDLIGAIIRSTVKLGPSAVQPVVTLPSANLAVAQRVQGQFGMADGIFGLADGTLVTTYQMVGDTSHANYALADVPSGQAIAGLPTYFEQLVAAGLSSKKVAFAVRRAVASKATTTPATDPSNSGVFILGGGEEFTDLYTQPFRAVAIVAAGYYNTNLLSIQVGSHLIQVPPRPSGSSVVSNSIIDSGSADLILDQAVYAQVIQAFNSINPAFGPALTSACQHGTGPYNQQNLILTNWPTIHLVFQGADGSPATVDVASKNYWSLDARAPGQATARICGDGGALMGQSILGLTLMSGHFVVFDRTTSPGIIRFADLQG